MTASGQPRRWRLVRARREAVPGSVRRFAARSRRRRLRAATPWLVTAGVLVVAVAAGWLVYGTSVLGVTRLRVVGTHVVADSQVRDAADVAPGTPLARVDAAAVARRVARLPAVAHVHVERAWPGTLVISVTERMPVAAVAGGSGWGLLDGTGVLYEAVRAKPAGLPQVRLSSPGPGDPATRAALRVLATLQPELRARLTMLLAPSPTEISLVLTGGRTVVWGDAEDSAKKARAAAYLLGKPGTVIDVSAPDVAVVR